MTSNSDIEFWMRVPVPERTRLVHTLVRGMGECLRQSGVVGIQSSRELTEDIIDVTCDITMSLWDYIGSA